jgi:2-polyprenyl-6-methoxyphenol hydroxylase-like FAD-dependent oxidoreductase
MRLLCSAQHGRQPPARFDELILLMGPGRFFGLVPVGHGGTYGFAGIAADTPEAARASVDVLRDQPAGFGEPVRTHLAGLERDEQIHARPIEQIQLDSWFYGRVVLVGDAAWNVNKKLPTSTKVMIAALRERMKEGPE